MIELQTFNEKEDLYCNIIFQSQCVSILNIRIPQKSEYFLHKLFFSTYVSEECLCIRDNRNEGYGALSSFLYVCEVNTNPIIYL